MGTDAAWTGLRGRSARPVCNTKHASLQNSPQPTSPHPCPDLHLLTFNKETTFGRHSPDILPMLFGRRLAPHKEQSYGCKKEIKKSFSPYSIFPLPPCILIRRTNFPLAHQVAPGRDAELKHLILQAVTALTRLLSCGLSHPSSVPTNDLSEVRACQAKCTGFLY